MEHQLLKKYYLDQARTGRGAGYVYYKGSRMQRGAGFGSMLSGLFKSPLVRKGLKYVAKTGISTAGDILSNVMDGQSFKQAAHSGLSRQAEIQKKKAIKKLKNIVTPNTTPQRFPRRNKTSKRLKPYRKQSDNFGALTR